MLSLVQSATNLSHLGRAYARAEAACWSAFAASAGSDTGVFGGKASGAVGFGSRPFGGKPMACIPACENNRAFGTKTPEAHT